jgi:hypothetical protein
MLIKQTTDVTCAPSALISIANVLGIKHSWQEMSLANELGCTSEDGTTLKAMGEFAVNNLSANSFGEFSWDGVSPTLAVITDERLEVKKRTHAVLILAVVGEYMVKYCPFFGDITLIHKNKFLEIHHSEDFNYKQWSINF